MPYGVMYLSGPITGAGQYWSAPFMDAERYWRYHGWDTVNPATLDPADLDYDGSVRVGTEILRDYLHRDFKFLAWCDAICLLPGWSESRGANAELAMARMMGLPIYFFETLGPWHAPVPNAMPKREVIEAVLGGVLE